jgi:hypothetical protein
MIQIDDANKIRRAVRACRESVGYFSLAASGFARLADKFLQGKPMTRIEFESFVSDLRRWVAP